jgi:hypothetical protein
MKKIYAMKLFTLVLVLLGQVTNGFGQVTTLGNVNGTATDFLGWNNTVTIGLNINHKTNSTASDINFLTRNTQRMQLNDNGLLGLGLTNQSSLLHLGRTTNSLGNLFRTDGLSNEVTNWTLFTGATIATVVERFRLYADATTTPWIGLRSASNGLRFETAGAFPRMRINGNSTATVNGFAIDNTGFVALVSDQTFWTDINSIKTPYSLLYLAGSGANYSTSSYRPWMRDGIVFTYHGDLGYIGPRNLGVEDRNEFVIQSSDNANVDPFGPDDLVFRFTRSNGLGTLGASLEGLEVMRCTGEGPANTPGRVSIGNEFSDIAGERPQRRLHVHDPSADEFNGSQLRLSQGFTTNFTDFRSTANGNLYLNMTGSQERVGIEEPAPLERLDVAGNARLQNVPIFPSHCVMLGQRIDPLVNDDIRFTRLDFSGNNNDFLAGDGTWQQAITECDWDLVNTADLATGFPGACRPGNVTIGESQIYTDTKLRISHYGTLPTMYGQRIFVNAGTINSIGLESSATGALTATSVIGVRGNAVGTIEKNFGGYFTAGAPIGGTAAIGCIGISTIANASSTNTGLMASAGFAKNVYGVHARAGASNLTENIYAVYGEVTGSGSNQTWAVYANGPSGGVTNWIISDEMLKDDILPMENGIETILALKPSTYTFKTEEYPQLTLPTDMHYGLLASNVQEVLPSLVMDACVPGRMDLEGNVTTESLDFKMVNYNEIIPVLVRAVQEQQAQIAELNQALQNCCAANSFAPTQPSGNNGIADVKLSNQNNVVLNQNVPNPFAERTTVEYEVNVIFTRAQMLFHDGSGKLIEIVDILQSGKGQINVFADDLSKGSYT